MVETAEEVVSEDDMVLVDEVLLRDEVILRDEVLLKDTLLVNEPVLTALEEEEEEVLPDTGIQLGIGTDSMLTPDCVPLFDTSYSIQGSLR